MAVIFSGENPGLTLFKPGTEDRVAAVSYWRCVYSEHGEGNAMLIWVDKQGSGLGDMAPHAIYTDNPGVAKLVAERFTQHFGGFTDLGFATMEPTHARFFQESDSRWYHRVVANHGAGVVELVWWDVVDHQQVLRQDYELGSTKWDLMTVICPCNSASITVNNHKVEGEVRTRTNPNGTAGSSSFLAFSETWVEKA
ncbi:MAG: hypothetical protein R3B97_05255 [Dehalococcoidia bacterium]|nr:hypothetical protein [Dehalococcoidia bacterium]